MQNNKKIIPTPLPSMIPAFKWFWLGFDPPPLNNENNEIPNSYDQFKDIRVLTGGKGKQPMAVVDEVVGNSDSLIKRASNVD